MIYSSDPDEIRRCDHCLKVFELWELENLTLKRCSILHEDETYLICEFCIGQIESIGEGVEEVQYWNEWVSKKRISNE